ncbi:cation-independent mannose-6-phosphate receptor [Tetranychus urticae]|uniref:cation-independent mannose-6-phosphate receptor n=1 Tax=Tetranychus urticae TaxID=32264 RepID=UPI00077C0CA1|nr:cation-independent mannose-6-phosphate receptor [Tetranychus urticae]
MENLIHIKRCSRLSWSNLSAFIASCFILISFFISLVNCVETKANLNLTTCLVTVNNNVYNLSSLVRHDGDQPWQLNTVMSLTFPSHQQVFINLCQPLPKISPLFTDGGCKESTNSSICLVDMNNNSTTSLADYNNIEASYDDEMEAIHLQMISTSSTINLYIHCNPTLKNNQPILVYQKANNLNIEWFDAAGCPKEEVIGEDCQVSVPSMGKIFDLRPLSKTGGYDFPEDGYHYYINVCGPINRTQCGPDSGICHYSKDGKMHYSLGKWSDKVSYSDGILTLVYGGGDPYRNAQKTPRVTKIMFICNATAGVGKPDFVEEANRTYIIHWETNYACPKPIRSVNCIWQNSTHRIDLSPFKKTTGNFIVPLSKSIVVINACSPINPKIHGIQKCPYSSGVCYIPNVFDSKSSKSKALNLGEPIGPPQLLFDDQINLLYTNGDPCPYSDPASQYVTRITFLCDRNAGEGKPNLIEGSPQSCEWLFEWKTSLVCEARPIFAHQCVFEDNMNGLKVDLTKVFDSFSLITEQENSTLKHFFINVCSHRSPAKGYQDMVLAKRCVNSSICYEESTLYDSTSANYISLGNLQSSDYSFQGESLILKFGDGSTCGENKTFSSEIDIKCSSSAITNYLGRDFSECSHKFFLESSLVCGLKSPSCTYRVNDSLVDLRELSSITHAWKVRNIKDKNKIYYFNLCNKIPNDHHAADGISSVVECDLIDDEEHCIHPIGRKDMMTMNMEYNADKSKKALIISYTNDKSNVCSNVSSVTTKIKLVCSSIFRSEPKFIQKIDNGTACEYHFEWETYLACFSHESERLERPMVREGNYFIDNRPELEIDRAINMNEIFNKIHTVVEGKYEYTLDLAGIEADPEGNCKNAAICQREINGSFTRDIGSLKTEMMVTQGTKVKLKLTATNHQKCGKNSRKNVTTTVFFQCSSSESGIGSPKFYYESNDCDYIFLWDTDIVCPSKMQPAADLLAHLRSQSVTKSQGFSAIASMFGALIIIICIVGLAIVPVTWILFRLSYREKRNYLVHWIRSKFRSPVITSFTYSQVSSDSTKLVSMNDDL